MKGSDTVKKKGPVSLIDGVQHLHDEVERLKKFEDLAIDKVRRELKVAESVVEEKKYHLKVLIEHGKSYKKGG